MLKIRDDVDLKELEKFGYYVGQDDCGYKAYKKDLKYNDYIAIYDDRTILIDLEDFCGSSLKELEKELLYDLIQAGLVEKVE